MAKDKNDERAERAAAVLEQYKTDMGERYHRDESEIVDLVTDLLHLAEMLNRSTKEDDAAQGIIDMALMHFRAETTNRHAKGE